MGKDNYIGLDVGSESLHIAVLDKDRTLAFPPESRPHQGNPTKAVTQALESLAAQGLSPEEAQVAFTGKGGEVFAGATGTEFFYDTVTIPAGAQVLSPEARYVFHIGAKDPYFFEKDSIRLNGQTRTVVVDNSTGTKCGGGSGILISKTVRRFFGANQEDMDSLYEQAYELAMQADKDIDVGGRCGVVIQSDMIHLQNDGEQISNILRGMFKRVAMNYKYDVVRTRKLENGDGIATGGVCANLLIVKMLEENLGVQITRPEYYLQVGAIGAAIKAMDSGAESRFQLDGLEKALELERHELTFAPPLSSALRQINNYTEAAKTERVGNVSYYPQNLNGNVTAVVLGVDGGSTTTKAVLLRADNLEAVAESIVSTHGRPLDAIQGIFKEIREAIGDKIDIRAVAYTGSSGGFYHKLFTEPGKSRNGKLDIVIDEITCHALGVGQHRKDVDTIFELGGQDAKFTLFNSDGTVARSKMNLSCMAGTGQTMENMMKMIGLNFDEFEEHALRAERTPIVDDTCGVFTEAGISRLISLGLPKEEIAAAIAYGFIGGYTNKFVGNEPIGNCISAQGGPFNSLANLAALALHTGREINAFPHRQLFGAYGAAIAAHQKLEENG